MLQKLLVGVLIFVVCITSAPALAYANTIQNAFDDIETLFVQYKNLLATSEVGALLGLEITVPKLQPLRGLENPAVAFGVSGAGDYDAAHMFIDMVKIMRPWIGHLPGQWGGVSYQDLKAGGYLDEKGWVKKIPSGVGTIAGVFAWGDAYGSEKSRAGKYILTYEGEGSISIGLISGSQIISQEPGKIVFTIKPNQGNWTVNITKTDPQNTGNYIRNISLVREDLLPLHQAGAMFNPDYLKLIEDARVIRYMGTMGANNSKKKSWSEEIVGADDVYSYGVGVPLEVLIRLANEAGVDPWFNMPFLADDDYNRKFAQYVKENLDPDLVAHVELSNEVWNWSFQQAGQSHEAGIKAWGLTPATAGAAWVNYMGKRSYEVMKIWTEVYGARAEKNLKRIAPTQTVSTWVSEQVLEAPMWKKYDPANYVPPHTMFDVLSPTTYFGGNLITSSTSRQKLLELVAGGNNGYDYHRDQISKPLPVTGTLSIQQRTGGAVAVIGTNTKFKTEVRQSYFIELGGTFHAISQIVSDTELRLATPYTGQTITGATPAFYASDSVQGTIEFLKSQKKLADKYGLQMIPYEGGQHVHHAFAITVPEKDLLALQNHMIGFVRSQQMADLYQQLWDGWKSLNTGPFMVFTEVGTPSKWGSWGMRGSLYDSNPRALLMDSLQQSVPVWWGEAGGNQYRHGRVVIAGSNGTTLAGTAAEDYIVGSAGDDVIYPGPANDGVNGGAGNDTLFLRGKETDYVITDKGAGKQIVGPDGKDYAFAIETFKFTEAPAVVTDTQVSTSTTSTGTGATTSASGVTVGKVVTGQSSYQVTPVETNRGMTVAALNPISETSKALSSKGDVPVYTVHYAKQQAVFNGNRYTVNYWNTNDNKNDKIGPTLSASGLNTALQFGDLVVGPVTIIGTDFEDVMNGRNLNDVFHGAGGNDRLYSDSGEDTLRGGDGNDQLSGGRGRDTVEVSGAIGDYTLTEKNGDIILSGPDGTDTLKAVELVRFLGTGSVVAISDWLAKVQDTAAVETDTSLLDQQAVETRTFSHLKDVSDYQAKSLYGEGVMIYSMNRYSAVGKELGVTGKIPAYHVFQNNSNVTINGVVLRPDYWTTNENKATKTSTDTLTDSAIKTALLFGDIVQGAALMKGTEFEDDIRGREHSDNFDGGRGNDIILGGAGEDTLYVSGRRNEYKVIPVKDWHQYIVAGPDGNDKVSDIEAFHFRGDGVTVPLSDMVGTATSTVLGASLISGQEQWVEWIDFGQFVEY